MKTLANCLFVCAGLLDAAVFWLLVFFGFTIGWNERVILLMIAFLVSSVMLIRAPYSRKNFDSVIVVGIRIILVTLCLWLVVSTDEADLASKCIVGIVTVNAILLIAVSWFRGYKWFVELPPPRSK